MAMQSTYALLAMQARLAGMASVGDARVECVDEPVAGFPKRPVPTATAPLRELRRRTLTNLYNERPKWLADAHGELDAAVAASYGWDADTSDDDASEAPLSPSQAR